MDIYAWAAKIVTYAEDGNLLREREERIRSEFVPYTWHTAFAVLREAIEATQEVGVG